jgi:dynein heavy chain, axonemal
MLLGVGGSGKQSLARLAGFMAGLEIATLTTAENYSPTEFLADIAALYILSFFIKKIKNKKIQSLLHMIHVKVGVKSKQVALIITDAQVPDERFLVILNGSDLSKFVSVTNFLERCVSNRIYHWVVCR